MWNEFNIKTFPAETIVFRDGVYCPDLSTIKSTIIDKKYDLPVHIIYVGEIVDKNELNINKENANSLEYIEQVAREKLNMYYPNEKIYVDNSK